MGNENAVVKPGMWLKRLIKVLLLVSVSLVALLFVARLIWRFSGSNQWEFVGERNGVKVYSLKAPGSDLETVKGVVRVRSTLASLAKMTQDADLCTDLGCYESKMLERVDDQVQYFSCRFDFPFPFHTRELVVRTQTYQNPHTKEILVWVAAAPDKTPPNDCCFRVTDMNNTWRYTPLGDGQVEVEHVENANGGGYVPDLVLNMGRRNIMFTALPKLQDILNKKYQNAKLDFIKEE